MLRESQPVHHPETGVLKLHDEMLSRGFVVMRVEDVDLRRRE